MKVFNLLLLASSSLLAGYLALRAEAAEPAKLGADIGEPPVGVAVANWIAVSEKLGFVVVSDVGDPKEAYAQPSRSERGQPSTGPFTARVRSATPPVPAAGYFMVKTANGWRRLVIMTPDDLAAAAAK